MESFDDVRLAVAVNVAADIERAVRFHLDTTESPGELARGWEAYRSAVGLRKSLDRWIEMRVWRRANPALVDPIDAVKA
jgi:hypothetical protein